MKPLRFESIEEAISVLAPYSVEKRLRALEQLGYDLSKYKYKELTGFLCASPGRVTVALKKMRMREVEASMNARQLELVIVK